METDWLSVLVVSIGVATVLFVPVVLFKMRRDQKRGGDSDS